jgi:hypothetical protein
MHLFPIPESNIFRLWYSALTTPIPSPGPSAIHHFQLRSSLASFLPSGNRGLYPNLPSSQENRGTVPSYTLISEIAVPQIVTYFKMSNHHLWLFSVRITFRSRIQFPPPPLFDRLATSLLPFRVLSSTQIMALSCHFTQNLYQVFYCVHGLRK